MRKLLLLLPVCALVAAALAPSSASAWTHCGTPEAESDCPPITTCIDGVETQVPDNGQYTPGECPPPPPKTVTVCSNGETITVPEDQVPEGSTPGECAVVPPPPPPKDEYVPPTIPPTIPETPDTPEDTPPTVDIDTPENEVGGKDQEKGGGEVAGTPENKTEVAGAEQSTLPFTGAPIGLLAGLGAVALLGGWALRRRVA